MSTAAPAWKGLSTRPSSHLVEFPDGLSFSDRPMGPLRVRRILPAHYHGIPNRRYFKRKDGPAPSVLPFQGRVIP